MKKNWFTEVGKAYPEFQAKKQLPFWIKIRLLFKPAYVAIDWDGRSNECQYALAYKWLDGRCYVLREHDMSFYDLWRATK